MQMDIVFPNGNEKEFIQMAEDLGYKEILFLYDLGAKKGDYGKSSKVKVKEGVVCSPKNIENAKRQLVFVCVKSSTEKDRWVLEKSKTDMVYGFEESQRKDYIHHRGGGLNQVLCKIAAQKKKTIGISFSSLLRAGKEERARIIGRMMQNARFCRKYKVKTILASFAKSPYEMRAVKDMEAFKRVIGLQNG